MTDQYAELRSRIGAAITRIVNGEGAMRVPADPTDPDVVLSDCRDAITALLAERDILRAGIVAVDELIRESDGVVGLHLNGDVAPWSDLLAGGRYEEWLGDLSAAMAEREG